jgi:hypothetical protein
MTAIERNMEQAVRRAVKRAGYLLCKERRRPQTLDLRGVYTIMDSKRNRTIAGGKYGLFLDDVLKFLRDHETESL